MNTNSALGPVSLIARDFRGLHRVEWTPEGVCLVAGPNGSGKTTLLDAFSFLRNAFLRGVQFAVTMQRGPAGLRRLDAVGPPEVLLGLKVGEVSWELHLSLEGGAVGDFPGETVTAAGGNVVVHRAAHSGRWYLGRERRGPDPEGRTCLRAAEAQPSRTLEPLVDALRGFQVYGIYALETLRNGGAGAESDEHLDPTGQNLFIVLRNWKAAPRRFRDQFAWVLRQARRAFPGMIDDMEFDPPVGQVVPTRFYPSASRPPLPIHRAADGLLVGLLHLTAVASAKEGAVIAIEEMEKQLHPHTIRSLLAAMREIAEERHLTILLTTHSPVLMNAFREHPEQFYVMEPGREVLPVALDQLHDPEWLAHFALGDLYDRMEFGAPRAQDG
jgi:predicted ATPase